MAENGFDFDARIERPAERHEAQAESVELLIAGIKTLKGDRRASMGELNYAPARSRARTAARPRVP